jgi:hypothetical protein
MSHPIFFAIPVVLSAVLWSQTPHGAPVTHAQTPPTSVVIQDQRGTQQSPLIVESSAKEQEINAEQSAKSDRENQFKVKRDLFLDDITLAMGLMQLFLLLGQLFIFDRQTRIMNGSLLEASRAADAARDSADEAKSNARLTQCADVLLDHIEMVDASPSFKAGSRIILHFTNFGPTRANNLRLTFNLKMQSLGDFPTQDYPVVLGPNAGVPLIFKTFQQLTVAQNVPDIVSGKIPFGFEGTISFDDVFGAHHSVEVSGKYEKLIHNFIANQHSIG